MQAPFLSYCIFGCRWAFSPTPLNRTPGSNNSDGANHASTSQRRSRCVARDTHTQYHTHSRQTHTHARTHTAGSQEKIQTWLRQSSPHTPMHAPQAAPAAVSSLPDPVTNGGGDKGRERGEWRKRGSGAEGGGYGGGGEEAASCGSEVSQGSGSTWQHFEAALQTVHRHRQQLGGGAALCTAMI